MSNRLWFRASDSEVFLVDGDAMAEPLGGGSNRPSDHCAEERPMLKLNRTHRVSDGHMLLVGSVAHSHLFLASVSDGIIIVM